MLGVSWWWRNFIGDEWRLVRGEPKHSGSYRSVEEIERDVSEGVESSGLGRVRLLQLRRPAERLLASSSMVSAGFALSAVFVSLFFYVTSGSVLEVALYGLGRYLGLIVMSGVIVELFPAWTPRRLFRVGLVLTALFYALLIVLGKNVGPLAFPLGLLNGAAGGTYWFGNNTLIYDVVDRPERSHYYGLSFASMSTLNVVMPLFAGVLIERIGGEKGFLVVFAAALLSFLGGWWISRRLDSEHGVGGVSTIEALKLPLRQAGWGRAWIAMAFHGFKQAGADLGMIILVALVAHSTTSQGTFASLASIAGVGSSVLAGRIRPSWRGRCMWIGAGGYTAAVVLLIVGSGLPILLVYGFSAGLLYPGLMVPLSSVMLDEIDHDRDAAQRRGGYVLSREIATNAGRIVAIVLLIALLQITSVAVSIIAVIVVASILQLGAAHLGATSYRYRDQSLLRSFELWNRRGASDVVQS